MKYSLRLEFDFLPKSMNTKLRSHYFKNHAEMKSWACVMHNECMGLLPPRPLKKARVIITRHSYRMLDFDGLVGSLKPVVDGLVTAGVLIDDAWNVTGAWEVNQLFREKSKGPLLEVVVQSVP